MQVAEIWRSSDVVCFDVDSTVCTGEGIDDLAEFCGVGKEVSEWTSKAMNDGLSFRDALQARLNIIKPSKQKVEEFLKTKPSKLTDGVKNLVTKLKSLNKDVYLVSGGFHCLIEPMAEELGVGKDKIFANKLIFKSDGSYCGFDETQPTSASGGKRVVAQKLKCGGKTLVMIGDGMTDLEAYPPADLFIGFGGNKVREAVKKQAPWYVTSFEELSNTL